MNNHSYICRREEKVPIKIRFFSQDLSHGHQEKSGTFAAIIERMKEFRQVLIRRDSGLSVLENFFCYLFLRGKKNHQHIFVRGQFLRLLPFQNLVNTEQQSDTKISGILL